MAEATLDRSTLLHRAVVGATGLILGGTLAGPGRASTDRLEENTHRRAPGKRRVLIAYFSRAGENYYYGERRNLKVGNTEVLARMIGKHVAADVHRIRAASPYPYDYEATVRRNVRRTPTPGRGSRTR